MLKVSSSKSSSSRGRSHMTGSGRTCLGREVFGLWVWMGE